MCVKNTCIHASKRHIYMRLKCLVKNIHWIRAHISRTHFETNGQPYDITGKYLYVKFPRMKTLSAKHLKIYIKISGAVQSSPIVQSNPVQSNCPVQSSPVHVLYYATVYVLLSPVKVSRTFISCDTSSPTGVTHHKIKFFISESNLNLM